MLNIIKKLKEQGFNKTAVDFFFRFFVPGFDFEAKSKTDLRIKNPVVSLLLALTCLKGEYAEGLTSTLQVRHESVNIASGDTLLSRVKLFSLRWYVKKIGEINRKILRFALKRGAFRGHVAIAVDKHKIPYYGKIDAFGVKNFLVRRKAEKGTHWFFEFITIDIIVTGQRFTIDFKIVKKGDSDAILLKKMLNTLPKYVKISYIAADKGFCTTDCINLLKRTGNWFVMPVKNQKVNKRKKELTKFPHKENYTMYKRNKKNRILDSATFRVVYLKVNNKIQAFATNKKKLTKKFVRELPDYYRKRWGIETGYRVKKNIRGKTTSQEYVIRYFYFALSVLLQNIWVLANLTTAIQLFKQLPKKPLVSLKIMTATLTNNLDNTITMPPP